MFQAPSGHVFRLERKRGPCWYAKYRLTDGRQVQKKLGPAWTGRGRPAAGYFTKRLAEDWLRETLAEARRGTLPGSVRTGATFADAAAEWLRYVEHDRDVKPSTITDYRSVVARLLPVFGSLADDSDVSVRRERASAGHHLGREGQVRTARFGGEQHCRGFVKPPATLPCVRASSRLFSLRRERSVALRFTGWWRTEVRGDGLKV